MIEILFFLMLCAAMIFSVVFAQDQIEPELDTETEKIENQSQQDENIDDETVLKNDNERTQEVFRPSEEIVEDAAVAYPVDI